jgi:hypothetical protein
MWCATFQRTWDITERSPNLSTRHEDLQLETADKQETQLTLVRSVSVAFFSEHLASPVTEGSERGIGICRMFFFRHLGRMPRSGTTQE